MRKVVDSNNVTHSHCNIVTKTRGILLNVWAIECDNSLSVHDLLDKGKTFDKSLDEYLKRHNLTVLEDTRGS